MPDLLDGETAEMAGSGAKPYQLKNSGGVYSCTCPAWRNQSVPIERRTCKHLRKYRGDDAETARVGGDLPPAPAQPAAKADGPPILLAESWDGAADLTGWWLSEKLDGVRAYWDGTALISRLGNPFHAPDWFVAGLPPTPLDGELWIARKAFQRTSGIVRRQDKTDLWKEVKFLVFDAPAFAGPFEARLAHLAADFPAWKCGYAGLHEHAECRGVDHLRGELARVEALGGEGLMLRQPGSLYVAGRSATLLKVKSFQDAEAVVVGYEPGKGRHKGRVGALLAELADGTAFAVGTGLSDRDRDNPPPVGSTITVRYQELSDAGVPRFPSFVGVRVDKAVAPPAAAAPPKAAKPANGKAVDPAPVPAPAPAAVAGKRYFECTEDGSAKFWEVWVDGPTLHTRWGKIGTDGRLTAKPYPSADKAAAEAAKLTAEKAGKGYVERTPG